MVAQNGPKSKNFSYSFCFVDGGVLFAEGILSCPILGIVGLWKSADRFRDPYDVGHLLDIVDANDIGAGKDPAGHGGCRSPDPFGRRAIHNSTDKALSTGSDEQGMAVIGKGR